MLYVSLQSISVKSQRVSCMHASLAGMNIVVYTIAG